MPINLITARSVIHVPYAQTTIAEAHKQTFFLDCACVLGAGSVISLDGITNPDTTADWLLHDLIEAIWTRMVVSFSTQMAEVAIGYPWVYQNETGGEEETFIGFDLSDYTDVTGGSGVGLGANQITINSQSASRQNNRLIFTDMQAAAPYKQRLLTVPDVDDDGILWFLYHGSVPFCTQDGERLSRLVSVSANYNDKLLRDYGFDKNAAILFP